MSSASARIARRPSRAHIRRRRLVAVAVTAVLGAGIVAVVAGVGPIGDALREAITLPLKHDDIIRQQAADKDLDPALIAAVINEESHFRDQTSHAGARGLMQITPETADFIARHSGGNRFVQEDLANPQINISYGSYFLRYLIHHYGGNETPAIAAYNAGQTNVDRWVARAGGPEAFDSARHIPFPETRAYVENVTATRQKYREHYADDLGL
jgi:soluble lytic murein transglycosylase